MSIVKLQNVRIAFATLFEPRRVGSDDKSEPRYSAAFIIDPKSAAVDELDKAIKAVAIERWKDKGAAVLKKLNEEGKVCFKRAARTNEAGEPYAGFEGKFSLNASNKSRPLVIDRDKSPLTAADGKPYSGCYVNASIEVWAQDNNFGRRINATLRGVQFHADGDSFGGGAPASAEEFDDVSEGADDTAGA